MQYLVVQRPKRQYINLRSVVAVVTADSKAEALREAKRASDAFEDCETHKRATAEPLSAGLPHYI